MTDTSVQRARAAGRRTGKLRIGKAVLKDRPCRPQYSLGNHRLREIEAIIRHRHGVVIPEADDADAYVYAAAMAGADRSLATWCSLWAPWADDDLIDAMEQAASARKSMLSADACAKALNVTYAEREDIGLQTIGCCDLSRAERNKITKDIKRLRDKRRARMKRRANGATPRDQSVAARKPWTFFGYSERTWYRKGCPAPVIEVGRISSPVDISISTRDESLPRQKPSKLIPFGVPSTSTPRPQAEGAGGSGGPMVPHPFLDEVSNEEAA